MVNYIPIIGLEVHVELSTRTKMFCACNARHFGVKPNTNTCPVCLGLPGGLPYANKKAILDTIKFGLALNCSINELTKFDRKHYFYPDLSKAFQTSQYDLPFCFGGNFEIKNSQGKIKNIRITRVHLEEDTGKLVHREISEKKVSLIDFNRGGVPLMELVTEPDFRSSDDVLVFLKEIQTIVRYLGISDADMEKGSMRLEANVSVQKTDSVESQKHEIELPDFKIELKNINSFKFLKRAIDYEIARITNLLKQNKNISQETRGYNETGGTTFVQRSKEEAKDYRYFPEPDIPPIRFTKKQISQLKGEIPELPKAKKIRFEKNYSLPANYVEAITGSSNLADYFETAVKLSKKHSIGAKTVAGVIVNQKLNEKFPEPAGLVMHLVKIGKTNFASSSELDEAVIETIANNPKAIFEYKNGKVQVAGFLIGQVQKQLKGKGDPKMVLVKIREKLDN